MPAGSCAPAAPAASTAQITSTFVRKRREGSQNGNFERFEFRPSTFAPALSATLYSTSDASRAMG
jgi:hypothetical protein